MFVRFLRSKLTGFTELAPGTGEFNELTSSCIRNAEHRDLSMRFMATRRPVDFCTASNTNP